MESTLFILAQIIGFFSLVTYCVSMQINNRIRLLVFLVFVNFLNGLVYFLLGSIAGGVMAMVSILRLYIFGSFAEKNKKCPIYVLLIFISLDLLGGLITYSEWYDILCITEAIVVAYGTYVKNMTITRVCHLFSCILMFTFNIFVFAYSNMLSEFIGLIFTFIGIIRLDILPKLAPEMFEKNVVLSFFIKKHNTNIHKSNNNKYQNCHYNFKEKKQFNCSIPQIKNLKK